MNSSVCGGLDEAGRGPVIGPMVMALVESTNEKMEQLGARDSKLLTSMSRERIYEEIMEKSEKVQYRIISANTINQMMEKTTINVIEETYAIELIRNSNSNIVYVDAFDVKEDRLSLKLSKMTEKSIICRHKADSIFPVVSAASIVAKVIRDREILKIEKKYGSIGSGYPSDERTISFLSRAISEGEDLSKIVRVRWSTYTRLVNQIKQKRF